MTYTANSFPIREDLALAHDAAWTAIAKPGTWLSGRERVAVASEIRHALSCVHCANIKAALSPNAVNGAHESTGALGAGETELIHRVVGDPGRLSEKWSQSILAQGVTEGRYVEITGLIAMVMIMDSFSRALGAPLRQLPAPQSGEPTRHRPAGAKKQAAWLPLVEPQDATEADGPMYPSPKAGYIYRGLSSVPQSLRDYWALANMHYLPGQFVYQFESSIRAIARPQIEIVAARISALHQCVY